MQPKYKALRQLGESLWLDYIRRSFIISGELSKLVEDGLGGVTSNPSIFKNAIAGSKDYDDDFHRLAEQGCSVAEIYERLAIRDIQLAADALRPVYDSTAGQDGFVSLEVSPDLAHDTNGTLAEARRLYKAVERPNVMIKVPATPEGIPAIQALLGEGINVNITLIFSQEQYEAVSQAFLAGMEELSRHRDDLSGVASVASFFISRLDSKIDPLLDAAAKNHPQAARLKGKIAIANARQAYASFERMLAGERWERLQRAGARPQRMLWASTSTKDPAYPDTLYVDELIGPHVVNTVPPTTLQAFLDHGIVEISVRNDLAEAGANLQALERYQIDLQRVMDELLQEGVAGFAKSFDSMMETIRRKREQLLSGWHHLERRLGPYEARVDRAAAGISEKQIVRRIWAHDHTVWKPDPEEIANRLGWLHSPTRMAAHLGRLADLHRQAVEDGIEQILLLGMGGSSLAPEVFHETFGDEATGLRLRVLDSTDPETVHRCRAALDLSKTLFIVATKSGGTVETLSFFKFFYNEVAAQLGAEQAGSHFIAITDPGSKLEKLAKQYEFRAAFLNDPDIGGRYSALSFFGLVPAALLGVDVELLLERAQAMAAGCESCVDSKDNPAVIMGAAMGDLAEAGRDKITFIASEEIASFGDWVEQLIAESTGKQGRGIVPIVGEKLGPPDVYAADRLFVHLRMPRDTANDPDVNALADAGHPVLKVHLHDRYDLGGQFFLWELATAIAGHRMDIQPFDQPNVEAAKNLAREMVASYEVSGQLPESASTFQQDGIRVTGDLEGTDLAAAWAEFLDKAVTSGEGYGGRSYVALQAYLPPGPAVEEALQGMRMGIRDARKLATTLGYGPRFLHSTGQLHKGDAGTGLFIQLTQPASRDIEIPDEAGKNSSSITFGVLIAAQALGDRKALLDAGRHVLRLELAPGDPVVQLEGLASMVA